MYAIYALFFLFSVFFVVVMARIPPLRETSSGEPRKLDAQRVMLTENYWLFAILKLFFLFIGGGFLWAVHDTRDLANQWWIGVPCYVIGCFGLAQLFFRRRHIFYPHAKRVRVEGFSLVRGRFARSYDYAQLRFAVETRPWGIHTRFFAIFYYPGLEISFFSSEDRSETEAHLRRLLTIFNLTEEPKTPLKPTVLSHA